MEPNEAGINRYGHRINPTGNQKRLYVGPAVAWSTTARCSFFRPPSKVANNPPSTARVFKPEGCSRPATSN
jgi:hypothetical protein